MQPQRHRGRRGILELLYEGLFRVTRTTENSVNQPAKRQKPKKTLCPLCLVYPSRPSAALGEAPVVLLDTVAKLGRDLFVIDQLKRSSPRRFQLTVDFELQLMKPV